MTARCFVILLGVIAACRVVPEPEHRAEMGTRLPGPASIRVVNVSGPLTRVGRFGIAQNVEGKADEHITRIVEAIQPTLPPDAGSKERQATMQIREAHLRANPDGGASIIGGVPADAPPGTEPALIRIDDCVIDDRIVLGPNVRVEDSVIRVPHAEAYDGGLPLFPHSRAAE